MHRPPRPCGFVIALIVAVAAGCGRSRPEPAKASVTGTVTLDGQPLATGEVFFISKKGESADRLTVTNGAFSGGVSVGPQSVQIASYKVRRASVMPGMPEEELKENVLPAKYGPLSDLVVDIKPGSNPPLAYDLKSEPKTAEKPGK
jgi:hypothetical protein